MNLDDLRYFLAVVQAGSMKAGARTLKVDHSTVSRRIAALEESLGSRLFDRTPEGLVPTDLARVIGPLAERIDLQAQELRDAATAATGASAAPIRIACSPLTGEHVVGPALPELRRRFPYFAFDVVADISRADLLRREADLAIRQHPRGKSPAEGDALARRVTGCAFAPYASRAYLDRHGVPERPIRSLRGHWWVSTGRWGPGDDWNAALAEPAALAVTTYPFVMAGAAVAAGMGIAVLPCLGSDDRFVRVDDVCVVWDVWLVTRPGARDDPRIQAVKDALAEVLVAVEPRLLGQVGPVGP